MMRSAVLILLGLLPPGLVLGNLVRNPGFEGNLEGAPKGWTGTGSGSGDRENGALVFRAPEPGTTLGIAQRIELINPPPAALRLSAEVKADGLERGKSSWHNGRLRITYLNEDGNEIGAPYAYDRLEGTFDWTTVSRQFPVPAAARAVELEIGILNTAAGEFRVRDPRLEALNAEAAEAWRTEAQARIRKHRMADLEVRVVDASGHPVKGAQVAVRMRRHAYPFGTAVKAAFLTDPEPDPRMEVYRGVVEHFFNWVTIENAYKDRWVVRDGLENPLAATTWLRERGIQVRGHVLTWPSWRQSPPRYEELKDDPDALRQAVRDHFERVLTATRGKIHDWDVLNEPAVHQDLMEVLGDDFVIDAFRWAQELDPDSRHVLNENNILFNSGNRLRLEHWARKLIEADAGLDALGFQGHMWHRSIPSGQNVLDDLNHFAPLGLPMLITEFTVNERFSEEEEARYLDELLLAWFSHPMSTGFFMWGFQDDLIWTRNSPLFRSDWSLKPSGRVWMEKVYGDWWTEEDVTTDANGQAVTRGFLGDYVVEASMGDTRRRAEITLGPEGAAARIVLDPAGVASVAPIGSFNPYTTGKLPGIQTPDPGDHDEGPVGVLLQSESRAPVEGSLYVRFAVPDAAVAAAELRVILSRDAAELGHLDVYALSPRFIAGENEPGLDWDPQGLHPDNAPGRSPEGEFDIGDARVLYVGRMDITGLRADSRAILGSGELLRLLGETRGRTLTLILHVPGTRPGVGTGGALAGPELQLIPAE